MLLTACKGGESVEVWVQGLSKLLEYFLLIPVISIEVWEGQGRRDGVNLCLAGWHRSQKFSQIDHTCLYYVLSAG